MEAATQNSPRRFGLFTVGFFIALIPFTLIWAFPIASLSSDPYFKVRLFAMWIIDLAMLAVIAVGVFVFDYIRAFKCRA